MIKKGPSKASTLAKKIRLVKAKLEEFQKYRDLLAEDGEEIDKDDHERLAKMKVTLQSLQDQLANIEKSKKG